MPAVVKNSNLQQIYLPHYESLTIQKIFGYLKQYPAMSSYFPDGNEIYKCPRQWIANVGFSVIQDPFGQWVKQQMEFRDQKVAVKGNLNISMDPDIAAAYAQSTAVSTSKGIGANMLKLGTKRRRTTAQIAAEKEEEALRE